MDYHPNFRDIPKLIKDHLSILCESPRMKKIFSSNKTCIRTGFHRTKNLKIFLFPRHSLMLIELIELAVILWGAFDVVDRSVMLVTIFYLQRNVLKAWLQARAIKSLSCHTDYIIYCTICTNCNKQCVSSSVKFRAKLSNYKSHIKQKRGRAIW